MQTAIQRRLPIGAEFVVDGAHFRVWAPRRKKVEVVIEGSRSIPLEHEGDGYFSGIVDFAKPGMRYKFRLDRGDHTFPDPASRFQPEGPHGPSQLISSSDYGWRDNAWTGASLKGQVIYEMHIGTFTTEGTWNSARTVLRELADAGAR